MARAELNGSTVRDVAGLPVLAYVWLALNPHLNAEVLLPTEHFFVVTVVTLLAAGVALLLARVAVQMQQYQTLFLTLGFMSLAGIFSVHALATPGVLQILGGAYAGIYGTAAPYTGGAPYAAGAPHISYAGTVVGVSALLSLFVPACFFAAGYTRLAAAWRQLVPVPPGAVVLALVGALAGYGLLGLQTPHWIAGLPLAQPPVSYVLAAASVALLGSAAWRQGRTYLRTGFPTHGALVLAYVLLAEAQVLMVVTPFWRLTWWEYHVLMAAAVVLALRALFLELDRKRALERFLPSEAIERVVAGGLLRVAGERRVVTVLFADLRGSTALAETIPAEGVVAMLNTYVGAMARCVFEQGGMLDKFLGDGLMAIFGVMADPSDGAVPAARAALAMRGAVAAVNRERVPHGLPALQFGVALNTGEVVLGAVGIPQRQDFTAIGDTVNTAAHMEALTKHFDVDVILSGATASRLAGLDAFRPLLHDLGAAEVRGRHEPVRVYTLGREPDGLAMAPAGSFLE
jgi:class 3 adenylate cyclase